MLPSRCRTAFVFLVTLTVILSYLPMPVSSLPIMAFQDRESYTSSSSYNDDKLVFDVSFGLGTPSQIVPPQLKRFCLTFFPVLLVTLSATCAWIACRMTIVLFITWVNREPSQPHLLYSSRLTLSRAVGRFHRLNRTTD